MATARGTQGVTLLGMARRNRPALLLGTALQAASVMVLAVPAAAQPAPNARPVGGEVVAGSAVISRSPQATTITQGTARAAVNWQKFDVGSQQTVRFAQPSVTASTLNRVTGPDPSQIAGRIQANGQVVLVNQSGVVFYKGAQVDVAGLVVSAAGITNKNFMAGTMKFDQPAHPNARIENRGTITIRQAGLAALVAPQVANSGVISAKLGRVVLAGAVTHTLDMYGDGLVSIDVSGEVRRAPVGPNGKTATALVTNTGTVIADGGRVLLTARAADGIVQNLVDAGGRVATPTSGERTGMVAIQGVGGSIVVTGQLDATGAAPGEPGGQVVVNATHGVTLARGAAVNASGRAGGGTVAIGTTLARAAGGKSVTPRLTAKNVVIAKGATVAADATGRGNGGRITVLSSESTDMAGAISARGGPDGGNGGFAEVSGASGFALTGGVDVSAPHGALGTILLDPNDLDVVAEAVDTNVGTIGSANTLQATGSPATVTAGRLADLGDTGNVELEASGSLGVHTNISVLYGLSLQAGGALIVDPGVAVVAGSDLGVSAGTDLLLGTGGLLSGSNVHLVAGQTATLSGLVQAGAGGTLAVVAKALDLSGGGQLVVPPVEPETGGAIVPGLIQLQADAMSLAGGQVLADDGAVAIAPLTTGTTLSLDAATVAGRLSLTPADLKAIQTVGALGANGGPLGTQTLVLGSLDGATASATTGQLVINTGVSLAGIASTLSLFSAGDVVEQGAGAVSVNALTGAAPNGRIALGGANTVAQIGGIATTGNFVAGLSGGTIDLTNYGDLAVVAPVIATAGSVRIVVHAGTDTPGTLTNNSTIQGATTVSLTADQDIYNYGSVIAGTDVTLGAGGDIENDNLIHADNDVTLTAGGISNGYSIDAGRDVRLGATNDIDNYGSITASRDGTLDAGGNLYNEEGEGGGGLIQVGNNATLHATNGIYNYGGTVTAGADATLSAGSDIYSDGLVHADNDVTLTAGGSISNWYLIDAGRDVHLGATEDIDNNGSVVAGRDATLVAGNDIDNYMQEISLAVTDGGDVGILIGAGRDITLQATRDINNDADIVAARNATLTAGRAVEASGLVQAGAGGTLTVAGPSLTLAGGGTLTVSPVEPETGGTMVPGLIQLQADAMSLAGGQVVAGDGAVAIAPLTAGSTLSFDATTAAGHLSLTQADLDAIQTIGALGADNGPLGTQTLVLGSLDGATASASTGRLEINAGMALGGIASTLSLFSAGDVAEPGAGAVSVNALTGAALNGHVALTGANTVAQIGNPATAGAFATAGNFVSGLSGGTIEIANYRDLSVVAPVIATVGSVGIAVHAGAGTPGTLGNASTIQAAATVGLSADQDINIAGSVVAGMDPALEAGRDVNNAGRVEAGSDASLSAQRDIGTGGTVAAGRNTTLAAGTGIVQTGGAILAGQSSTGTLTLIGPSITQTGGVIATQPSGGGDMVRLAAVGTGGGAGTIALGGALAASQLVLSASGDIDETGTITAGFLTGTAGIAPNGDLPNGTLGSARLIGATPGANRIATLGAFVTTGSLSLSDGQALTIAGPVMTGVIGAANPQVGGGRFGATIDVAGNSITVAGNLTAGVAAPGAPAGLALPGGDIALNAGGAIAIPGAIEAAAGANGGGTLTTTAGSSINETGAISAAVLTGSAGGAANFAGDGGASNAIQSLGAFTAGDFGLTDGRDLFVAGPVTANAGSVALTAHAGHGTAGTLTNGAAITAIGNVSLAAAADLVQTSGAITAGRDAALGAGRDITQQAGGTISAGGTATLAAGQAPPGTLGGLTLGGIISGTAVRLSAPQDIVETGVISTATLSGNAGLEPSAALPDGVLGSATLTGATPAANRIGTLGAFLTTGSLVVNDGQALTVAGPVTTGAIAASNSGVAGRSFGAAITAPAITVAGQLTAGAPAPGASGAALPGGDVVLAAVGSIELSGILAAQPGSNGGGSLVVNAGAGLHQSGGAVIAGALRGAAGGSVTLDAGQNRIASIGDFTVLPAATGNFRLTNIGDLWLGGTLTSNLIVINDTAGQIIFGDGAAIVTGGTARPDGAFRAPVESDGGAYLTDFVQLGRSTVAGINGGPSVLAITALANGSIVFDSRTSSGLYAPGTWLVLTLGNPSGVGTLGSARGNVVVRSLDLQFRGTGGQADLGGTIANLSGAVAAGSAGISPRMDANYRFNACPIHSVHCVILAVEGLPPGSPLEDLSIAVLADKDSDEDLLLPIISDRDYTLTGSKSDHDLLLPIISDRDY